MSAGLLSLDLADTNKCFLKLLTRETFPHSALISLLEVKHVEDELSVKAGPKTN